MKKKKPAKAPRLQKFNVLANAIGAYLDSVGWSVILVGTPRVQQQLGAANFNYEFVVRFTGGKKR